MCLVSFLPLHSSSRDLAPGRCEADLRFFHFSGKIKDRLVCCHFFSLSIYSEFNCSSPPQAALSASVNEYERLEIVTKLVARVT